VQKYLKVGFHHCYAFKESPGGKFLLIVNPVRSFLEIDMTPNTPENFNKLTSCTKYVRVVVKYDLTLDRGHFCRFNCVEVIKSLLGIKETKIFTPYQLFKRLKKCH